MARLMSGFESPCFHHLWAASAGALLDFTRLERWFRLPRCPPSETGPPSDGAISNRSEGGEGPLAPVSVDLCGLRCGASVVRRCETTRTRRNSPDAECKAARAPRFSPVAYGIRDPAASPPSPQPEPPGCSKPSRGAFDSLMGHHFAREAQQDEHRPPTSGVAGSTPAASAISSYTLSAVILAPAEDPRPWKPLNPPCS